MSIATGIFMVLPKVYIYLWLYILLYNCIHVNEYILASGIYMVLHITTYAYRCTYR